MKLETSHLAFVSHASEDELLAVQMKHALEARGIRTWIDNQELHHRDNEALVGTRVWDGLGTATDFVVVASAGAMSKPWVAHEVQVASERWIATGSPRIWIVSVGEDATLPEIPYIALLKWSEGVGDTIAHRIQDADKVRGTDAVDPIFILALRSQYLMGGSTAVQAINKFDAIFPILKSRIDEACDQKFAGDSALAIQWLRSLSKFLDLRANQSWLCTVLGKACSVPSPARPILLNNLGTALLYRGVLNEAACCFDETTKLWKAEGDWIGVAVSQGNQALLSLELGDLSAAHRWIERANESLKRAVADGALKGSRSRLELLTTLGNVQNHFGRALARAGEWHQASEAFGDHLALAVATEDRRATAAALGRTAWLDVRRDRTSLRTRPALDRYLSLSVSATNPRGVAHARAWRGHHAILAGTLEEAAAEFQAEAAIREHLSNSLAVFRAHGWAGICLEKLERTEEARYHCARAVKACAGCQIDTCDQELALALVGKLAPRTGARRQRLHPALRALIG